MEASKASTTKDSRSILLVVLSLIAAVIGYLTSIVVARLLGPDGYENYAVAIASLALMTTFAESGTGKYALRVLPGYVASKQWTLAAGYWRFALLTVVLVSIVIATIVAVTEGWEDQQFGDYPLGIAVLFLPAAALAGAGVDFVMANRAAIRGSLIARVLIPGSTLLLILACGNAMTRFTSSWAVACYGMGSVLGATASAIVFWRSSPRQLFSQPPTYQRPTWARECFAFLMLAMLMTLIFRISIIVLELLPVAELEVAWFAAAMETGCLILLLAKSTDKYFQPYISIMIEQEAWESGIKIRRQRRILIGATCLAFLGVIFVFGKPILRLHGAPFEAGYPALCLISIGTCTWTLFSLAPTYLKFVDENRFVFATTIGGALAMAILTGTLGYWWGATGAALAFCIVLCSFALACMIHASHHFSGKQSAER